MKMSNLLDQQTTLKIRDLLLVNLLIMFVMFIMGFLSGVVYTSVSANSAIEELRAKQPQMFKQFEGYEFSGYEFVKCIKEQKTVLAENTIHCLGRSAYKP